MVYRVSPENIATIDFILEKSGLNFQDLFNAYRQLNYAIRGDDAPGKWLTMQEAITYAKVSRWTLRRWANAGNIKMVKLSGSRSGKLLILASTLTAWLDSLVISSQTSEAVTRNG